MSHAPTPRRWLQVIAVALLSVTALTACKHDNNTSADNNSQGNAKKPVMDCAPK